MGDVLAVVKAYATKTKGYTRSKVSYSDNWFRLDNLSNLISKHQDKAEKHTIELGEHDKKLANWIKEKDPKIKLITPGQINLLTTKGLVSTEELHAAGLEFEGD